MATADDIPSDLALEIGEDIDPRKFVASVREFFAYVESAATTPGTTSKLDWRVKVRDGSSILALVPAPTMLRSEALAAYARVEAATKALVSGDTSAARLDDATLEHARKLSELTIGKLGSIPMRVWVHRKPILFGPTVADFIREETKPTYQDFGSIEGTLNAIQDGSGGLQLRIRDPLWQRAVKCFVPEGMLADAMRHFRERVELSGEIYYRKDDTPESIRVARLEMLPSDDDLPDLRDMRGMLASGSA